ncbi:uncharacterized protein LOC126894842 [Daktulosphaira vitifoliae]|uniref:uncharacterized protein LOC126894842 n=1 Tax=Daktulosphaira vitifoliae TaxID=58002 RepID=UPI0021A978DB|nr:uncharacterized protein LOC126894842 [Daktulosphaira vitifoliae]
MMKDIVRDIYDHYPFSVFKLSLNTEVKDNQNQYSFIVWHLLLNDKEYSKNNIVTRKNLQQKISYTMTLINYEYIINLAFIVNHIKYISSYCNIFDQWVTDVNGPTLHAKCVNLLIRNVNESKELIPRYISAINFLRNLLNVETNTDTLDELIQFIELVSREKNENDYSLADKIYHNFKEVYEMDNNNLQKIVNNYSVAEYKYCVNKKMDDFNKYKSNNKLPKTFQHYEFAEVILNKSLEQMKNAYAKHGFLYDIDKNETFYLYDVIVKENKKSCSSFFKY